MDVSGELSITSARFAFPPAAPEEFAVGPEDEHAATTTERTPAAAIVMSLLWPCNLPIVLSFLVVLSCSPEMR
jgi:hypothetical protein